MHPKSQVCFRLSCRSAADQVAGENAKAPCTPLKATARVVPLLKSVASTFPSACRSSKLPIIAAGKRPIGYVRREYGPGAHGTGGGSHWFDRNQVRLEYLATLLKREPHQLPLELRTNRDLEWRGEEAYRADVLARPAAMRTASSRLV